jgi:hypothetical protein
MRKMTGTVFGLILLSFFLNGCKGAALTPNADVLPPQDTIAPVPENHLSASNSESVVADTATPTATITATATPPPTATFTATPSVLGPHFESNIDPLTGLPVDDPSLLNRRPLAIKVSNFPADLRPHSGMSFADIVFHYFTEQGMTRFLALFLGKDSPSVGPIRSARMVDAQLTFLYQAILGYVGGDPTVIGEIGRLADRAISERPSTCPAICRGPNGDVNSVFANTGALTEYAIAHGILGGRQNLDGMVFDTAVPAGGTDLSILHVRYSWGDRSEWRYDPVSGRNQRFIEEYKDGELHEQGTGPVLIPLVDRVTKQPISAANSVVVFVQYWPMPGNEKYEVEFWATKKGRALLFRDGKLFDGFWGVTKPDAPLIFQDAQGNSLPFKPGNTWVEIVGVQSRLTGPKDGRLDILFQIP